MSAEDTKLDAAIAALPTEVSPPSDLWPGIRDELAASRAARRPASRWVASLALVATTAVVAVLGWRLSPEVVDAPLLIPSAADSAMALALPDVVTTTLSRLPEAERATYEVALLDLARYRWELERAPVDEISAALLQRLSVQEADLISDVTRLSVTLSALT